MSVWLFQSSWSAFARSAPFLEQGSFYNAINFSLTYSDPPNTTVAITPLPFLYCPSDPGSHIDDATLGGTGYATTSYGTCDGDWYVWSVNWGPPNSVGPMNKSLFGPNYSRRIAMVTDGLSNTLMASEGLIGHAQMRSCMNSPIGSLRSHHGNLESDQRSNSRLGLGRRTRLGHRVLRNGDGESQGGRADRPHPVVQRRRLLLGIHDRHAARIQLSRPSAGRQASPTADRSCRWTGIRLMRTTAAQPTCRWLPPAITPGGVNAVFGDGSVRWVKNTVDPTVWRGLGTIAGGEVLSADQY